MVLAAVLVLLGCDKLKKDSLTDGGEAAPSAGGGSGGLLSFLGSSPFEGEIALSIHEKKSGKPPLTLIYEVKNPKMRLDVPADAARPGMNGKSVWMLIDPPQKKMYAVTDDEKKAVVFDLGKMGEDMKKLRGAGGGTPGAPSLPTKAPPKIEKTGKMDKVAGYECEIWKVSEEHKNIEICAAKGISWFDLRSMGGGAMDPKAALLAELTDINHFPLRVVVSENGVEAERIEATRIDKKKMDDARFQVPAGYQVIDMAAMLQGFGGLSGMGSGKPPFPVPPPRKKP